MAGAITFTYELQAGKHPIYSSSTCYQLAGLYVVMRRNGAANQMRPGISSGIMLASFVVVHNDGSETEGHGQRRGQAHLLVEIPAYRSIHFPTSEASIEKGTMRSSRPACDLQS